MREPADKTKQKPTLIVKRRDDTKAKSKVVTKMVVTTVAVDTIIYNNDCHQKGLYYNNYDASQRYQQWQTESHYHKKDHGYHPQQYGRGNYYEGYSTMPLPPYPPDWAQLYYSSKKKIVDQIFYLLGVDMSQEGLPRYIQRGVKWLVATPATNWFWMRPAIHA